MNVLIGVHQFFPHHYAGTERYVLNLARQLQHMGHGVHVLTYDMGRRGKQRHEPSGLYLHEYDHEGIAVTALHHPEFPDFDFEMRDARFYEAARALMQQREIDLYHCAHPFRIGGSVFAARDLGLPVVLMLTDYWLLCPMGILRRSDNVLCEGPDAGTNCTRHCYAGGSRDRFEARAAQAEALAGAAQAILSPSRFLISVFRYNRFPHAHRIRHAPHGFDYSLVRDLHGHTLDPEAVTLGYIGTIQYHKGVHVLVEGFRKVEAPNLRLKVWGGSFHEKQYERKVRASAAGDPRIEFLGPYAHDALRGVLEQVDLVVVPSVWYENAPLTITSALAAGVPVIASDIGGMAEFVQDGVNGLLFAMGNAGDLARRLAQVARDPELVRRLRDGITPPPGLEEEAFRMERLYRGLLDGGEAPRGAGAQDVGAVVEGAENARADP